MTLLLRISVPLLVVGLVSPALARKAPKTLVVREGLTAEQLDAEGAICLEEAKAAERGHPIAPIPASSSNTAQIAGAATSGMLKGFDDMRRFMAAHDACLARFGYRQVELTPEQRREYAKLKDDASRIGFVLEFSRQAIAAGKWFGAPITNAAIRIGDAELRLQIKRSTCECNG